MSFFYTNVESNFKDLIVSFINNGKRGIKTAKFSPKAYIKKPDGNFKSIYGELLEEHKFENLREYRKFINEHKDTNLQLYGSVPPQYQFIREFFSEVSQGDINQINTVYFDIEVSSLDKYDRYIGFPEAHIAPIPIVSIAVYSTLHNKMTVWGFGDYDKGNTLFPHINIDYIQCKDEYALLFLFAQYLTNEHTRPDVLYGWNSSSFDIPYIHNRMMKIGGKEFVSKLSPFGNVYATNAMRRMFGKNEAYLKYNITGIPHLDMIDVYRKFSGENCSFSMALNNIAKRDLNEKKLDYGTSRSLMDLYWDDYQRYIDYNIKDTYLLKLIDDKRGLTSKVLSSALTNKCNLVDTLGTTKQWETILYNKYMDKGLITPPKIQHEKIQYDGGYVRDSIIGVRYWNVTFDFKSLYPNIMIGMNMSPETLTNVYEPNCVTTPLEGVYFSKKERGVLAGAVKEIFIQRKEYQKLMKQHFDDEVKRKEYDTLQQLCKLDINSIYGASANTFFTFFKADIARAITAMGQYAIKAISANLNGIMNVLCDTKDFTYFDYELDNFSDIQDVEDFIVMGDTDSCAISFEYYVNKFLKDKSDEEILEHILGVYRDRLVPAIEKCLDEVQSQFNFYEKSLVLQLEGISKKSIFLQKKRYLGHVVYDDGKYYMDKDNPKFKIKGVEGIKSSTSDFFQEKFMEFYKLCLIDGGGDILRGYIKDVEREYLTQNILEMGKPVKANNLSKYKCDKKIYISRTPEATKGSLLYNSLIELGRLESKYNLIREGDNCILLKLHPNSGLYTVNNKGYKISQTCIAVPTDDGLPLEFGLEDHIDLGQQFAKFFKNPCEKILEVMKINPKKIKAML